MIWVPSLRFTNDGLLELTKKDLCLVPIACPIYLTGTQTFLIKTDLVKVIFPELSTLQGKRQTRPESNIVFLVPGRILDRQMRLAASDNPGVCVQVEPGDHCLNRRAIYRSSFRWQTIHSRQHTQQEQNSIHSVLHPLKPLSDLSNEGDRTRRTEHLSAAESSNPTKGVTSSTVTPLTILLDTRKSTSSYGSTIC